MEKTSTAGKRLRRGKKAPLGERERRRLGQLAACLILFALTFWAKGAGRLSDVRDELTTALTGDADFQAAFADLGWSVAAGRPVGESLGELCQDVFLPQQRPAPESWQGGPLYESAGRQVRGWVGETAQPVLLGQVLPEPVKEDPMSDSVSLALPIQEEEEPEPAVVHMDYDGPALPKNTTMDKYALGLEETATPALGPLTSDFGWREHPIDGGQKFHYGVDLAVPEGTAVGAFAAGTVEYIGQSDVYGLYLQIDHGNGVESFYAHCSKLCVEKGQQVEVGEKVAESGATGKVTGAHLHFELKKDGVRLEPLYYIETAG